MPFSVHAASGSVTLTVEFVSAASATHPVTAVQNIIGLALSSTTQLGTCPLFEGKVYLETDVDDKAVTAFALAAHAAGRAVQIAWDDSFKNARGICKPVALRVH